MPVPRSSPSVVSLRYMESHLGFAWNPERPAKPIWLILSPTTGQGNVTVPDSGSRYSLPWQRLRMRWTGFHRGWSGVSTLSGRGITGYGNGGQPLPKNSITTSNNQKKERDMRNQSEDRLIRESMPLQDLSDQENGKETRLERLLKMWAPSKPTSLSHTMIDRVGGILLGLCACVMLGCASLTFMALCVAFMAKVFHWVGL